MPIAIAIARHLPAFEAPGVERRSARRLRKILKQRSTRVLSLSVHDGDVYAFLQFLLSDTGRRSMQSTFHQLCDELATRSNLSLTRLNTGEWNSQRIGVYDLLAPVEESVSLAAMVAFRPQPLLPLSMSSARRAVTFVHGFIALVTANAYISTLGGGHFLCLHLDQAKVMARLQIAIADALYDPVLKSKCRVNLAYNAMREGRFRRAQRYIKEEEIVAQQLENDELVKICEAAQVYLVKTIRLHQEFQRKRSELTLKDRALVDNFYRQRIVRKSK